MSAWLREILDKGDVSGVRWVDKEKGVFSIAWVHKSSHNFDYAMHSDIFQRYASYRGLDQACDFKASFRCAMNTLKDVEQLTKEGAKKGAQAKRTFRFLSPSDPKYGRNRKAPKNQDASCKGRKCKRRVSQLKESPSSSPSSSSCSYNSAVESSSPSPSLSPSQIPFPLHLPPSPQAQTYMFEEDSVGNIPSTVSALETAPLQGSWTSDVLLPFDAPQPEEEQKANLTFITNGEGITSVSPPVVRGEACSPVETKVFSMQEDQPRQVQVEPNMQSGGMVTGLPNFSELGVSDTYSPEETITNAKLTCGGQFKVREGKNFALPIPIDLDQFCAPFTNIFAAQNVVAHVPATQQLNMPCEGADLHFQAEMMYPQLNENVQSDLSLGQTLEISDGMTVGCSHITPQYQSFTPQEDMLTLEATRCGEAGDVQSNNHIVSEAFSGAVAILNDAIGESFSVAETEQALDNLSRLMGQDQQLPVEVQPLEHPDYLLSNIYDDLTEDGQDIFQMGAI